MAAPKTAPRLVAKSAPRAAAARFYVDPDRLGADRAILTGSAYHHLRNVRRMKPGDDIVVFDGAGREGYGVVESFQGDTCVVRVLGDTAATTESSLDLTLAPCLAKGKKTDLVIEKAIELGVARICVVISERSVGRLSEEAGLHRVERWRRIAISASEQPATLRQRYPDTRKVVAIVGPEGGLTREEIQLAREHGFHDVGLGPRVLRAETAAIVAAAVCQHLWGDLGRRAPGVPRSAL